MLTPATLLPCVDVTKHAEVMVLALRHLCMLGLSQLLCLLVISGDDVTIAQKLNAKLT